MHRILDTSKDEGQRNLCVTGNSVNTFRLVELGTGDGTVDGVGVCLRNLGQRSAGVEVCKCLACSLACDITAIPNASEVGKGGKAYTYNDDPPVKFFPLTTIPSMNTTHRSDSTTLNFGLFDTCVKLESTSPMEKTPPSVKPVAKERDKEKVMNCEMEELSARMFSTRGFPSNREFASAVSTEERRGGPTPSSPVSWFVVAFVPGAETAKVFGQRWKGQWTEILKDVLKA